MWGIVTENRSASDKTGRNRARLGCIVRSLGPTACTSWGAEAPRPGSPGEWSPGAFSGGKCLGCRGVSRGSFLQNLVLDIER